MTKWFLVVLLACLATMATSRHWGHGNHHRRGSARSPMPLAQSLGNYHREQSPRHSVNPRKDNSRFDSFFDGESNTGRPRQSNSFDWGWEPMNFNTDPFDNNNNHFNNRFLSLFSRHWNQNTQNSRRDWWQGPNVCEKKTEEVLNVTESPIMAHFTSQACDTSETAYKCVSEESYKGQKQKTTVIYECCHDYNRKKGDYGCPKKLQLKNLINTAKDLGLTEFLQAVDMLKLTNKIKNGNYTVFAPVNGAFDLNSDFVGNMGNTMALKDAPSAIEVTEPALERTLETFRGAIFGHLLVGTHRSSALNDEHVLRTGHPQGSTIRINYFSRPDKLMTANCVPVISRDNRASNGVIHTVEKALPPVTETLLDFVRTRPDLSTLKTVLSAAAYVPKLEEDGQFTLLAPTNEAFNKMNPRLKEKLLKGDKKCIENVLLNHILPNVICSSAFQKRTKTLNHLKKKISVTRSEDGRLFANHAQVVVRDIMALNGVMHIIDDVLIPEEALGFLDVLEKKGFSELISLVERAGLTEALISATNLTFFAPTNAAFQKLPLGLKSKLGADKDLLKKVLTYHVSSDNVNTGHFRNDKLISTLEGRQVRLNRYTNNPFFDGVTTAQCSVIESTNSKTCNGHLNVLSQVMIPPLGNVVDVLASDKRFSTLVSLVKKANLVIALEGDGPFTVFAPNNKAFEKLDKRTVNRLTNNPTKLAKLLKSHVYQKNLCCAGIFRESWFTGQKIHTLSGTIRTVTKNRHGKPTISNVPVVRCDRTATNGNILEIDEVLMDESHPWKRCFNRRNRWSCLLGI